MDAELLTLTDEQVEHLGKGKLFLFFSLEIKYDDGFGEKRTTRYLIVHEGRGQDFKYCGTGNWAD